MGHSSDSNALFWGCWWWWRWIMSEYWWVWAVKSPPAVTVLYLIPNFYGTGYIYRSLSIFHQLECMYVAFPCHYEWTNLLLLLCHYTFIRVVCVIIYIYIYI
jgi:hypothetical protein